MRKMTFMLLILLLFVSPAYAGGDGDKAVSVRQERKLITSGNKLYSRQKYSEALKQYEQALKVNPQSAVAIYNAGLSRLRLAASPGVKEQDREQYEKSGKQAMESISKLGAAKPELAARASYNLGNLAFNSQDYRSALNYYKQALRLNPNDNDARRNLRITQKKLNDNKNQDNKNQNKNQDKNKDKQDKNKEDKKNEKDKEDKQNQQDKKEPQKPPMPDKQISQQTADQILKAMENKESQTRARVMNPQKQNQNRRQSRRPW